MWMKPEIEPVPPEPGPPDMPEGAPPDALDGRLGEPPVWPSTLSQYITAHSAAHTQLDAWHTQVSATSSALADQRLWEGPDQQSQATSWANLGAQHVAPAKLAMQSVQESLTAFRTSLAKARQEARELLRKADAHMARAKEWQGLARERLIQAQARLIAAQRAIADAILTAGVATPELFYQEEEAIRELAAATKWQAESIEDGFQAEA